MRCSLRTAGPVSPGCSPRSEGAREALSLDAADAEGERTAAANTATRRNISGFGERCGRMSGVGMAFGEGKASRGTPALDAGGGAAMRDAACQCSILTLAEEFAPVAGGEKSRRADPDSNLPGSSASSARQIRCVLARQIRSALAAPAIRESALRAAPPRRQLPRI